MRDARYEKWLDGQGVKWTYEPAIPLARFLTREGLQNKARLGKALDPVVVETYALAMMDGAEFPAVIGEETTNGIFPINGNHRLAAAKEAEKDFFACYLASPSTVYVRERMIRSANRIEGQPLSTEDAIIHALHMVKTFGIDLKKAAAEFGVPYNTLVTEARLERVMDRTRAAGIDPRKMVKTHLAILEGIRDDSVFAEATKLARKTGLPSDQVQKLVADVNRERNHADQLGVVQRWAALPEVQIEAEVSKSGNARARLPQRAQFFRLLRGLDKHLERHPTASALGLLSPVEIEEVRTLSERVIKRLIRITREERGNGVDRQPKGDTVGRGVALTTGDGAASS